LQATTMKFLPTLTITAPNLLQAGIARRARRGLTDRDLCRFKFGIAFNAAYLVLVGFAALALAAE
jgi:hypothetical protein